VATAEEDRLNYFRLQFSHVRLRQPAIAEQSRFYEYTPMPGVSGLPRERSVFWAAAKEATN
jgi:hypothetical protein